MNAIQSATLPHLYEYYIYPKITAGLNADKSYFTLNEKSITLYSGAMHYFRVPPQYWRDRLRKMRAAGLNAVETYVPWNLHEPQRGSFDFGAGGSDFQDFLNVTQFLKIAQEEDLLAIVRPGPFICAEWEWGGLPSWLLRIKNLKVRTSDQRFLDSVTSYFNVLLPILAVLQFTQGGPIVAVQLENEYASGKYVDHAYLSHLKNLMLNNGITELLFTSDVASYKNDSKVPGVLQTVNFGGAPEKQFKLLESFQPNIPLMVMEYWTGWFDHWTDAHNTKPVNAIAYHLEEILRYPASVNIYMFHGGTNWGFMNGANDDGETDDNEYFAPITTSYDYNAPLTESGDCTKKYYKIKNLIHKYNNIKTRLPRVPKNIAKIAYVPVCITQQLKILQLIQQIPVMVRRAHAIPMEFLPINNKSGQSYGYTVYRKVGLNISKYSILTVKGRPADSLMVLINGKLLTESLNSSASLNSFGSWKVKNGKLNLSCCAIKNATLDIIAENWGRVSYGNLYKLNNQHKGIWQGTVLLNMKTLKNWQIYPLEFKSKWTKSLRHWQKFNFLSSPEPTLYKAILVVEEPKDTFIDMSHWTKGIVIVNDFILGRYASNLGPQQTLYLPGPFLRRGRNEIKIFEHFFPSSRLEFSSEPIFFTPN